MLRKSVSENWPLQNSFFYFLSNLTFWNWSIFFNFPVLDRFLFPLSTISASPYLSLLPLIVVSSSARKTNFCDFIGCLEYQSKYWSDLVETFNKSPIEIREVNENLEISYWLWLWPGFCRFDSLILHTYFICRDHNSKKATSSLKMFLLQIEKRLVFPALIKKSV